MSFTPDNSSAAEPVVRPIDPGTTAAVLPCPVVGDGASSASPAEADRQFVAETVAKFGPTIQQLASGRTRFNLASMGRIVAHTLGLAYDAARRKFVQRRPAQPHYEPVTVESVTHQVGVLLQRLAAIHPVILGEIRPRRIAALVSAMRLGAPQIYSDAGQELRMYVERRFSLGRDQNLTVEEIHADYLAWAKSNRRSILTRIKFHKELPKLIQETFGIPRINNVKRLATDSSRLTARRGFVGIKFKTDGTDGADGLIATKDVNPPG